MIGLYFLVLNIVRVSAAVPRGNTTIPVNKSPVNIHHGLYYYHPPSYITFTCRYCTHPDTYPVYHGLAPAYVFRYYEETGKFRDLLAGLALYNLGRASVDHHQNHFLYVPSADQKCSLQLIDRTFEETRFDCIIMSSFLNRGDYVKLVNTTWINITSLHTPVQVFRNNMFRLDITNSQVCMLWHNRTMVKERKDVPCALLLKYANTLAPPAVPVYVWMPTLFAVVIIITLICQACKKTKENKDSPTDDGPVIGYRTNIRME